MTDDFMTPGAGPMIEESIGWLEQCGSDLTKTQCLRLHELAQKHYPIDTAVPFASDEAEAVDVGTEIKQMMKALRGLRRNIMTDDGHIREGNDPRDAKEIITSTTQLLSLLMKSQERLDFMERMRIIEDATVQAVKGLDKPVQDAFFQTLEEELA